MAERMNQDPLFINGPDLANLVVNSDLLQHSWNAIWTLYTKVNLDHHHQQQQQQQQSLGLSVSWEACKQSNCTVIAFVTSPICTQDHLLQQGGDLVSSATLRQNFPHFDFLCSKGNPSFSIHEAAITLFATNFEKLWQLKTQLYDSTTGRPLVDPPLIITGHSLGGSIASLFMLCLLDSLSQRLNKLPLCITFGSPLIGDKGFQRAISERSWNSCFLHIAANQDPVPRLFVSLNNPQTMPSTSQNTVYMPFGTFLLCSELGATCVEDTEVVLKLLVAISSGSTRNQVLGEELQVDYYGNMVEHLKYRFILRESSQLDLSVTDSLGAGIILQLEAIGVKRTQEQQQNIDFLIEELKRRECVCQWKKKGLNASRKLNDVKIRMAYLEWYKKDCKAKGIGYYDSYKNQRSTSDIEVAKIKKFLTNYWKEMVEEAERKPLKERRSIRMTWLFAGINYRRMVEPLDIAEYHRGHAKRNYQNHGRSNHYKLLEQWQKEDMEKPASNLSNKKKNVSDGILTEDSCFWANLEEALIACKLLKDATSSAIEKQSSKEYLINFFEQYVLTQIMNYAVSPEIFLGQSSFMTWWKEFKEIVGTSYNSAFTEFMNNCRYKEYEMGRF